MDDNDRAEITRTIGNLWAFHNAVIARLMLALVQDGALSRSSAEQALQAMDRDTDALEGEDDRGFATAVLAGVRSVLAAHGAAPEPPKR